MGDHYTTLHSLQLQLQLQLRYFALHYTRLHYPTLQYATLVTPPQVQLQLHYAYYTTPQLQLHYTTTTTTAALHHTTSSSCGWGDRPGDHCNHCNHSKYTTPTIFHSISGFALPSVIHNNYHQPTSPIGFLVLELPPPCAILLVMNGNDRKWHNL